MSTTISSTIPSSTTALRLGARGSLLSRMQSQMVAETLQARHPGLKVELTIVRTTGDEVADRPLHALGGKGLFTKEIEEMLLSGEIDFAVHSLKDVPVTMPLVNTNELITAAIPAREDPRDVLVSRCGRCLADLPLGARVGTASLRRQAQALRLRPDLNVSLARGNVDTRLRKLHARQYDALILAAAGLRRAELFDEELMTPLDPREMLPAAGQGALALQCRKRDLRTRRLLTVLDDPPTGLCTMMERMVVARLEGDCHSPIAAYATLDAGTVSLHVAVGRRDGRPPVLFAYATAPAGSAEKAIDDALDQLVAQGVRTLLQSEEPGA